MIRRFLNYNVELAGMQYNLINSHNITSCENSSASCLYLERYNTTNSIHTKVSSISNRVG